MRVCPFRIETLPFPNFVRACFERLIHLISEIWNKNQPNLYSFVQQSNRDCHLVMWKNLEILRGKNEEFNSRLGWLSKGGSDFLQWLALKNRPAIRVYLESALKNNHSSKPLWNPIEEGIRKGLAPSFLTQIPPSKLTITLPSPQGGEIKVAKPNIAIGNSYIPQGVGIFKLLLRYFGLDQHNQLCDEPLNREIQQAIFASASSWSLPICKKENLIEVALADLFKESPLLFHKVAERVDFYFPAWKLYCDYSKNGNLYMPGKEQMLAYTLMKNIQYLWVASMSARAFYIHMGLPSWSRFLPFLPSPYHYIKKAYAKKGDDSFLDLWKEIRKKLLARFPAQKDWATFSGHGMVLSFDPSLMRLQNKQAIENKKLALDLGFAGIDSLHGNEMDLFYKKRGK